MSEMTPISRDELDQLKERARQLAKEKSNLQLSIDMMNRLSTVSGLDKTVQNMLQIIVETIGGRNLIVYTINGTIYYFDVYGNKRKLEVIDDPLVKTAFELREIVESERPFSETKMETREFTKAFSYAVPLMVENELIGVLKLEDMLVSSVEMRKQLEPFMKFAALALKNELYSYARLKKTFDELSVANAKLSEEIMQRQEAESSLRITQFAVDHASDNLFWIRPDAVFANVNDSTCRRLGYSRDELLTMTVFDVDPAFPREAWDAHWQEIKERKSFTIETMHRTKAGEVFPVEVTLNYVEYEGAEYDFAFARDISERKRAEGILRQSNEELEEKVKERTIDLKSANEHLETELAERRRLEETLEEYRKIVESSSDMMAVVDRNYRYSLANEAFLRYRNTGREQIIGRTASEVLGRDIFESIIRKNLDACFQGKVVQYEMKYSYPAHDERDLHVSYFPVEEAGQVTRVASVIRDITERKRAEEALRNSEQRLRALIEHAPVGIAFSRDGMTLDANAVYLRMFGYGDIAELRGTPLTEQIAPQCRPEILDRVRRRAQGENVASEYETTGLRKDGSQFPFYVTVSRIILADGPVTVSFFIDITDRKLAEKALQSSEERYRSLILKVHAAIVLHDGHGIILHSNPLAQELLGLSADQLLGKSLIDPEWHFLREDGSLMPLAEFPVSRVLSSRQPLRNYVAGVSRPDRSDIVWVLVNGEPEYDAAGEISRVIISFVDISERKRIEEKLLITQFSVDSSADAIFWVRPDGSFSYWNKAACDLLGYSSQEFTRLRTFDLNPEHQGAAWLAHWQELRQRKSLRFETELLSKDRLRTPMEITANHIELHGQEYNCAFIRDISKQVQARVYGDMGRDILRVLNEPGDLQSVMRKITGILKTGTGFEAVGVRMQYGEDYPYFAQDGFPEDFLRTENTLIARDAAGGICRDAEGNVCLECTCGQVLSDKTDPTSPYVTQGGSCWTNDKANSPFIDTRLHPRDRCLHEGFQSVALVPIRTAERIVGMLQLNDRHKGRLNLATVELLEGIASHISSALLRKQAEEELKRSSREWSAAMDASEDAIYLLGLDRRVIRANKTFYMMTRSTPEIAVGKHITELVHPGGEKIPCPVCVAQEEMRDLVLTMEPDHPDNPAGRPVEITLRIVRDDEGKPMSMFMTLHDLTHERKVQEELTKYRERLEVLVTDRTAEVEKKNRELEKMNKLFVGRELRMVELKKKIRELEKNSESRSQKTE